MQKNYKYLYEKYKTKYQLLKAKTPHTFKMSGGAPRTERTIIVKDKTYQIDRIPPYLKTHIDDYWFAAVCWAYIGARVSALMISSTGENFEEYEIFWIYASQSELDYLRLLHSTDSKKPYYKGKFDYTQQTFIDVRLQIFIQENLRFFPYGGDIDIYDGTMLSIVSNEELGRVIDDEERKYEGFRKNSTDCGRTPTKIEGESEENLY